MKETGMSKKNKVFVPEYVTLNQATINAITQDGAKGAHEARIILSKFTNISKKIEDAGTLASQSDKNEKCNLKTQLAKLVDAHDSAQAQKATTAEVSQISTTDNTNLEKSAAA